MIEVASIGYGCVMRADGHVESWPLRIAFGAVGPETTVEEMLEGRGHTVMPMKALVELVQDMAECGDHVQLVQPSPDDVGRRLVAAGFTVELC